MQKCNCGRWTNYGKICSSCMETESPSDLGAQEEIRRGRFQEVPTRLEFEDMMPLSFNGSYQSGGVFRLNEIDDE